MALKRHHLNWRELLKLDRQCWEPGSCEEHAHTYHFKYGRWRGWVDVGQVTNCVWLDGVLPPEIFNDEGLDILAERYDADIDILPIAGGEALLRFKRRI